MLHIDPATTASRDFYQYLIGAVSPRPIAWISTLDGAGNANLAPYSFFNAFSGTPPIVAFSAARRKGPAGEKDTLNNIVENGELVINVVSFANSRQMALTSVEYPPGTDEFEKAGLTKLASELVKPFRVAESAIQMECRVEKIIPLHENDNGASMVICRIVMLHISPEIMNEQGRIDPQKADLMGRMGRQYYVRASGEAVLEIAQDTKGPVIGFDGLPWLIRESKLLTGNQLAQLAALSELPGRAAAEVLFPVVPDHPEQEMARLVEEKSMTEAAALLAILQ